ncbi:MAG: hypothetical protein WCS73_10745 [Lentisphaeria bacterium]
MTEEGRKAKENRSRVWYTIGVLVAIVICFGVYRSAKLNGEKKLECQAVLQMNQGQLKEAIPVLEQLFHTSYSMDIRERSRKNLVDCYERLIQKNKNNEELVMEYYYKMVSVDPNRIPRDIREKMRN